MESKSEKQSKKHSGVGKTLTAVLIICFATLVTTNFWFFIELRNQRNLNYDLRIQKGALQNQLGLLNSTYQSYTLTHSYTDSQYSDLVSEYHDYRSDHLHSNSEFNDYVHSHQYSNLEYWNYVDNHLHTNSEYDEACLQISDLEWQINDLELGIQNLQQTAEENRFEFYYASLAKQRFGVDDLDEYLDRWEWIEGTYVKGVFDCSEMSAYIEWRLENEGYNAYIVCGESPWGGGYHAWLLVETSEGAYMPVEATEYSVVWWDSPYFDNYFEYDNLFETIHDALNYSYGEFDWWN